MGLQSVLSMPTELDVYVNKPPLVDNVGIKYILPN